MRGPTHCWNCRMPFTLCGALIRCFICKAATNPERSIVGPGAAVVFFAYLIFVPGAFA